MYKNADLKDICVVKLIYYARWLATVIKQTNQFQYGWLLSWLLAYSIRFSIPMNNIWAVHARIVLWHADQKKTKWCLQSKLQTKLNNEIDDTFLNMHMQLRLTKKKMCISSGITKSVHADGLKLCLFLKVMENQQKTWQGFALNLSKMVTCVCHHVFEEFVVFEIFQSKSS